MTTQKIGFVGVGRMGANMARRLKDGGYKIAAVFDVDANRAQTLAKELSAEVAKTLADVTRLSDVIITVVTDDAAMVAIYGDSPDSLLSNAAGKLFINTATISPAVHVELATKIAEADGKVIEAPMASSIPQAREGKLFMMCAGDQAVVDNAKPLLNQLAQTLIYTGKPGTAANMKALVNMVMNINTAGLAEGLGLAQALGMDLAQVREVFAKTGAASRVLETDGSDMIDREHDTYFSAAHAAKDSHIALALAEKHQLPLPLAKATASQYDEMIKQGLGELDKSGIAELTFPSRRKAPITSVV